MGKTVQVLVDTNILVDAFRGVVAARSFILKFVPGSISCSVITAAELWAGTSTSNEREIENVLEKFQMLSIGFEVARQAGGYVRRYSRSHGLELADALIAATAHVNRIPLVTRNIKHFPMDDIQIVKPY